MDADPTVRWRPLERAGRAAARYRAKRDEIEPLIRLVVDVAALTALLRRWLRHRSRLAARALRHAGVSPFFAANGSQVGSRCHSNSTPSATESARRSP